MNIKQHNILAAKKKFSQYATNYFYPTSYSGINFFKRQSKNLSANVCLNSKLLKETFRNDAILDGIVKGEYNHWKYEDVKALDVAGNNIVSYGNNDESRDLIAMYAHEGEKDSPYSFRVDLFDLQIGAEINDLDLYFLISWPGAQNGTNILPDGKTGKTDRGWNVAVKIDNVNTHKVVASSGKELPDKITAIGFDSRIDAIQFALDKTALREAGWQDNQPLYIQAFTCKDGDNKISDFFRKCENISLDSPVASNKIKSAIQPTIPMNITTNDKVGQGRLAYTWHGNQELRTGKELSDLVSSNNGTGFMHLLDSIERWKTPMELHLSGTLQAGLKWSNPEMLDRVQKLVSDGLVTIQGGTFDEQIMVFFPGEINQTSLQTGEEWAKKLGQKDITVGWTPERIIDGNALEDFRQAGYKGTIADYLKEWFPNALEDNKIHRINGMNMFFIDHAFQERMVEPSDEGLDFSLRKDILKEAIAGEKDKIHVGFNDWELVAGFPFNSTAPLPFVPINFDNICRWLASHPWIDVTTPTKFLAQSPNVIEHGTGNILPTQTYLGKGIPEEWYYGGKETESYFNYVPLDRGEDFGGERDKIVSGNKLGDQKTPGTIIYDTWNKIKNAPNNAMKELAMLSFYTHIYETAWHDLLPPPATNRISGWERDLAGQIRQNTILAEAAHWADKAQKGELSKTINIKKADLNQDGDEEVVATNNRLFLVFSPVGGRVSFAAYYDPQKGPIPMAGNFLAMPSNEGEAEVNPKMPNKTLDTTGRRLSLFRDSGYDDAIYSLDIDKDNNIMAASPDKKVIKKYSVNPDTNSIEASYKVDSSIKELIVGVGLSPNLLDLLKNGQKHLAVENDPNGTHFSIKNTQGGSAELVVSGAQVTASHRNFPQTHALYIQGCNEFKLSLSFQP